MRGLVVGLWRGLAQPRAYGDLSRRSGWFVTGYFLVLVQVTAVALVAATAPTMRRGLQELAAALSANLPDIQIVDGVVSTTAEQPFIRTFGDGVVVIDTRDTPDRITEVGEEFQMGLLLTRHELIYKANDLQTRTFSLSQVERLVLDRASLELWTAYLDRLIWPGLWLAFSAYYTFSGLVKWLGVGLVGLLLAQVRRVKLPFGVLCRYALFALTGPTLVGLVLVLLPVRIPLGGLLYLGIALGMVWVALGGPSAAERSGAPAGSQIPTG